MIALLITIGVVILTWLLCLLISNPSSRLYVLDNPTHRSLHDVPKPKTGGLAIFTVILISWLIITFTRDTEKFFYYLIIGMILLAIISYLDDRISIPQIWRLIAHFIAAVLLIVGGLELSANEFSVIESAEGSLLLHIITIFTIVWMINLFNFMDGMDGLAGGMCVIGFSCLSWLGWAAGNNLYMTTALIVAAANLGFLLRNFPPAKIFMGDVGSITMGYLVAFFSLWGIHSKIFQWWVPILLFSPFIVDATATLIRRFLRGEKVWEAHKSHYYQRLVQHGWGHRKTAIFEYILMFAAACSVIFLQAESHTNWVAHFSLLWILTYILIIWLISRLGTNTGHRQ